MLKLLGKIFGTKNDRELKKYKQRVEKINSLEEKYKNMSDEDLKSSFLDIKTEVLKNVESGKESNKILNEVLYDVFAITREASVRTLKMRHYDVQLVGGMVLNENKIAEMKTGEGKTLVATLPVVLNAMLGKGVHVVTVNDYLASRDAEQMSVLYSFLGFTTGIVVDGLDESEKRKAYASDITYGTNNEFGFDYLRDNMVYSLEEKVQRGHFFAIVDEVDSILIDEARTPLIISGPTKTKMEHYAKADEVAKELVKDTDFTVDEKNRTILLTEDGLNRAEELFEVGNLYTPENAVLAHHLDQALKANYLFEKDVDYIVRKDEVLIIDEFTGRVSEGRRFSEGLHQALEAKEKVEIKEESQTLADITFQNYFRLYEKLAGMTGTAQTEATEFAEVYNLEVISIPTNRPLARIDKNDLVYKTEMEKFEAAIKKVKELHKKGQPVLIGTASIEKSEIVHHLLKKEKLTHTVLNAKNHEKEAEIILNAGQKNAITVATNMAGRGVDIKLGEGVLDVGGLAIIGTERHESRRIDNQLRGRGGRQGDIGFSQFFLSLDDNLLRIFGSDKIKNIMERLGIEKGEHIESKLVTRAIENAQKKVETMHFESRKHMLKYDDVAVEQKKVIYKFRDNLLNPEYEIDKKIEDNRIEFIDYLMDLDIYNEDGDINLEKLCKEIQEATTYQISPYQLENKTEEEIKKYLLEQLTKFYEDKSSLIDDVQKNEMQRVLYLQVLDEAWRDHLYQMDILKTGIGLRGYNQKDPLVEYKKESFNLFNELIERVKFEYMKVLHSIQLEFEEEKESKDEDFEKMLEQISNENAFNEMVKSRNHNDNSDKTVIEKPVKKQRRNEKCACGSGKKYKDCCGKSGPKKGILANK